jgi:ankyrin repeat protein
VLGRLTVVQKLYDEYGIAILNVVDGVNALHTACEYGELKIVKYLVETAGADPVASTSCKDTPLHIACASGDLGIVKYLVELDGASIINAVNIRDETPLHGMARNENGGWEVMEYLVEHGADIHTVRTFIL